MPYHNDDGSSRYSFEVGGGALLAPGGTRHTQTLGGAVEAAAGLNFNKYIALQGRAEYDQAGVPGRILAAYNQQDGKVQVVSAQINSILHYYAGQQFRAYVVLGSGYFRRVTRFYYPGPASGCLGGSCNSTGNNPTGFFHLDTVGAVGGLGFEWRPSVYSNGKIFLEGRYDYIKGQTPSDSGTQYPLNSRNAQMVPVLMGVRW